VLSDPAAVPALGIRDAGAVLRVRVAAHEADGLTRLESSAGPLWLPRVAANVGAVLRVRIAAQDVMLALARPEGVSALNILPATVTALRLGDGPGAVVQLRAGDDLLLARVTRRSAGVLGLAVGLPVFAVVKSVAVAQGDVGGAG
jgi:molybdate transport system ATP-binding protein